MSYIDTEWKPESSWALFTALSNYFSVQASKRYMEPLELRGGKYTEALEKQTIL